MIVSANMSNTLHLVGMFVLGLIENNIKIIVSIRKVLEKILNVRVYYNFMHS